MNLILVGGSWISKSAPFFIELLSQVENLSDYINFIVSLLKYRVGKPVSSYFL